MSAKKAAAKKADAKPKAPKAPKPRKAEPRPKAAKAPKPPKAEAAPKAAKADAPPKPTKAAARTPVEKERVVFPKDLYEARKDDIKAPLKERGLKWQYLGEGKGRYAKEGVNLFAQFLDDGVHYSLWGDDRATVQALLKAWRDMLGDSIFQQAKAAGEQAVVAETQQKESEALSFWKLQEPQRRAGEPDFFFKKRMDEWMAKKPA